MSKMESTFLKTTITRDTFFEKISKRSGSRGSLKVVHAALKNAEDMCQDMYARSLDEVIAEMVRFGKNNSDECNQSQVNFLQSYVDKLSNKGFRMEVISTYMGYLRKYTHSRGLKVSDEVRDDVIIPKTVVEPRIGLEKDQIKELLMLVKDQRYFTLILFLVSTACRIQEAMNVKVEDLEFLPEEIAKVSLKAEYVKGRRHERTTFASKECVLYLRKLIKDKKPTDSVFIISDGASWWNNIKKETRRGLLKKLGVLDKTVSVQNNKLNIIDVGYKDLPEKVQNTITKSMPKIDPQKASDNAITWFYKLRQRKNLAKTYRLTKTDVFTFHSLRAYFETIVSDNLSHEGAHAFLGHQKYMITYYRKSEQQRIDDYLSFEPLLHILDDGISKGDLDERDQQIRDLVGQIKQERASHVTYQMETKSSMDQLREMFNTLNDTVTRQSKRETKQSLKDILAKFPAPAVQDMYTVGAKPTDMNSKYISGK
jgi:integrase